MKNQTITLAMTGASGAIYGLSLLENLLHAGSRVYLLISKPAQIVLNMETDLQLPSQAKDIQRRLTSHYQAQPGQLRVFGQEQWTAPIASGSGAAQTMVVCPCTASTLAAIATGSSNNLIERAADVMLKEGRKLILVPREMPFSAIHLEHMLKLARLGTVVLPACPGFYHRPETVQELVNFVVARILDHLGIEHSLVPRWGGESDDGA